MFKNEFNKSMHGMSIILVVFATAYFFTLIFEKNNYDGKLVFYYSEYMDVLEGEITPDKEEYIKNEYECVVTAIERNNELIMMGGQGIDTDAFKYAFDHQQAFTMLFERYEYLSEMDNNEEQKLYYDLDWLDFLEKTDTNYFEIFMLVIIVLYSITLEFYDEKDVMIKTSDKGRIDFILVKQNALILITVLVSLGFFLLDMVYMLFKMDVSMLLLPIRSMQKFSDLGISLSIGEYIIVREVYHVLWCVVSSLLMVTLGLLVKRFQIGLFIGMASIVIPLALRDIAGNKYWVWIYSLHMSKNFSICNYGITGVTIALAMMIIIYIMNLLLWGGLKNLLIRVLSH